MSSLRTNYKDDVFTGSRKYEMTQNGDGTVSFTDQTTYSQVGDTYGAAQINEANAIINNLDDKAYLSDDSAESGLADNDYFPFYDTSATSGKRTTWSNIKNLIKAICAIKDHASNTASTYGAGTGSQFGHVKLSDSYLSSGGAATNSVGASSAAVNSAYTKINNQLKANSKEIYMDFHNGKYGINTSANRGADTFIPFNRLEPETITISGRSGHSGKGNAYGTYTSVMQHDGYAVITNIHVDCPSDSGSTVIINNTKGTRTTDIYSTSEYPPVTHEKLYFNEGDEILVSTSCGQQGGASSGGWWIIETTFQIVYT